MILIHLVSFGTRGIISLKTYRHWHRPHLATQLERIDREGALRRHRKVILYKGQFISGKVRFSDGKLCVAINSLDVDEMGEFGCFQSRAVVVSRPSRSRR